MQQAHNLLYIAVLSIIATSLTHADDQTDVLPIIKLTAQSDTESSEKSKAYTVKNSRSSTKLNIPIQETPQTVTVVTRQQLEDFDLKSTRDILNSTAGVTVTNNEVDRTSYTARGFDISNILVDGVGIPSIDGYNYNGSDADSFFYDRIEVTKGADALTNALGDPGATINYIRKRPTKEFQASGGISYGSWDTQRYEADVSGSLTQDGRVRARLSGYEQAGNSYIDRYSKEKNGIQAIIEADLTNSTTVSAGYSKTHEFTNGGQWGGLPLINASGQQLSYASSYNYAPSWTYWDYSIDNYFADLTQKLGGDWKAKFSYNEKNTVLKDKMLYLYGAPSASNNTSDIYLYPEIYNYKTRERTFNLNFDGTYTLFGQQHEAALGYSWSNQIVRGYYAYGSSLGEYTTDLASWTPATQTWGQLYSFDPTNIFIRSLYGTTRLHLSNNLKLLLGANYTQINYKDTYNKNKVSPYAGLTYNFTPNYTGYVSYTSIFRAQNIINNATDAIADPIEGKSYEFGLKSAWLDKRLTGSIALFRTEQSNYPISSTYNYTDNLYHADLGTVRSQGVELSLSGQITDGLNISAGYTKYSFENTATGENPRTYYPTQTFNLLTTYAIPQLPRLKVGANFRWQDEITDTLNGYGVVRQGAYGLLGLMAAYEVNKQISLQVNGDNITNKKYLAGVYCGQGYYGAPANYTVAVKFKY
ncbi:MAG: TonB-dependent siderophore receptor [Acinetobacter sp.]